MLVEINIFVGTYVTFGTYVLVVTLATLVVLSMAPSSNTTEVITPHA